MANTAPSLTGANTVVETSEQVVNNSAIEFVGNATFVDPDGNFAGAVLRVSGLLAEDRVQLASGAFASAIASVTGGFGTDLIVTFSASATAFEINYLIRTMYYSNLDNTPTASRRLLINFTDSEGADFGPVPGGAPGERGIAVTVNVTPSNDQPVVDLNGPGEWIDTNVLHIEGATTRLAPAATVSDVDSDNFDGGMLTVAFSLYSDERLVILNQGNGAGQIGVDGSNVSYGGVVIGTTSITSGLRVSLNANATAEAVQALIRQIGYQHVGTSLPNGPRPQMLIALTDGDGAESYYAYSYISYQSTDTPPVLDGSDQAPITYDDGHIPQPIGSFITVTDPDSATLTSATVRFTGGFSAGDTLSVIESNGNISASWDAATGVLTLTATGPGADVHAWNSVLRQVGYSNTLPNPATGTRTISITINDATSASNTIERSVNVVHVNDAPVIDLNGAAGNIDTHAQYIEQGAPLLIAPDAVVTDMDSANFAGGTFRVVQSGGAISTDSVVAIQHQGNGAGQIGVSGSEVRYGGTLIGTIGTGPAGTPLTVSLNAAATPEAVQAMTRAVTYFNPANTPNIFVNYAFELIEADGVKSFGAIATVRIELVDDPFIFDLDGTAAGTGATGGYAPGTELSPVAPFAVFSDDDSQFQGARFSVRITNPQAGDTLGMFLGTGPDAVNLDGDLVIWRGNMIGSIQLVSAGYGILTFTNIVPGDAIQAVLRSIGYANTGPSPSGSRTISFEFIQQGKPPVTLSATVVIGAAGEPIAVADTARVTEGAAVNIAVLANDSDSDGPTPAVGTVNGASIAVGQSVTLASGATVTLNSDGTLRYNTGSAFNHLVAPATAAAVGAANGQATDSFSYVLAGSNATATVTVTVNGTDNPGDRLGGTASDDTVGGTGNADVYDLSQGGDDSVSGGDGNDAFFFGAAFTGADRVNGGAGTNDQVALQGMYVGGAALVLEAATLTGVEVVTLLGGGFNRYDITTVDGNVPAGGVLTFFGTNLGATNDFTFNGAAETDGAFRIYGGAGTDLLTGGGGNDGFWFGPGRFNPATDRIDGGGGSDQLALDGVYDLTLDGTVIQGIEAVTLQARAGNSYTLTALDNFVGAGETRIIWGLLVTNGMSIDVRAETDGHYRIFGSRGGDSIIGGAGNDWMFGGEGGDLLAGAGGSDTFFYDAVSQSTGATFDTIVGFDPLTDRIDLPFALTGIAATVTGGSLSLASFDTDLAALLGGGQLGVGQALMLTANAGGLAGNSFLVVDANGVAGYQAGEDYVIRLLNPPDELRPEAFV
ncbi:beta strand repeat-containing protein [Sphingomonas sp. LT1P40]|uniref:beta strand repeat-containing protein n=1 Tax=Alteristakelama amylovorans TaxID=3096166 RepID=UPI002FC5A7FC